MKYNIDKVIDFLAELTGSEIRMITHEKKDDSKLPLAIACCYTLYDVEFMETIVPIAVPSEFDNISPMLLSTHQTKMMEVFHHPVVFAL